MKRIYKKYFGELLLVLSALSYSFEWLFIRNLFENGYNAVDITFAKSLFSALILGISLLLFQRKTLLKNKFTHSHWFHIFLLGFLGFIANIAFSKAIDYTTVTNVLIVVYLSVFWTFIFGVLFFKEHFSYEKLGYIIFAFLGLLLVLMKKGDSISFNFGLGEGLASLVSVVFAWNVIINKYLQNISVLLRSFLIFAICGFFAFMLILYTDGIIYFEQFFKKEFLIDGFLLALTSGVLATIFIFWGIQSVPVSLVLVILLLDPIAQMTTAYFFAEEKISLINFAGIFLVFAMVIMISRENKKKELKTVLTTDI